MLVVSRRYEESVYLILPDGTAVVVKVTTIDNKKTRLGFTAPKAVKVMRAELLTEAQRAELDKRANT